MGPGNLPSQPALPYDRHMSDEKTAAPKATPSGLFEHWCEHPGCKAWGGHGFQRSKNAEQHWFCYEHTAEGEQYIG